MPPKSINPAEKRFLKQWETFYDRSGTAPELPEEAASAKRKIQDLAERADGERDTEKKEQLWFEARQEMFVVHEKLRKGDADDKQEARRWGSLMSTVEQGILRPLGTTSNPLLKGTPATGQEVDANANGSDRVEGTETVSDDFKFKRAKQTGTYYAEDPSGRIISGIGIQKRGNNTGARDTYFVSDVVNAPNENRKEFRTLKEAKEYAEGLVKGERAGKSTADADRVDTGDDGEPASAGEASRRVLNPDKLPPASSIRTRLEKAEAELDEIPKTIRSRTKLIEDSTADRLRGKRSRLRQEIRVLQSNLSMAEQQENKEDLDGDRVENVKFSRRRGEGSKGPLYPRRPASAPELKIEDGKTPGERGEFDPYAVEVLSAGKSNAPKGFVVATGQPVRPGMVDPLDPKDVSSRVFDTQEEAEEHAAGLIAERVRGRESSKESTTDADRDDDRDDDLDGDGRVEKDEEKVTEAASAVSAANADRLGPHSLPGQSQTSRCPRRVVVPVRRPRRGRGRVQGEPRLGQFRVRVRVRVRIWVWARAGWRGFRHRRVRPAPARNRSPGWTRRQGHEALMWETSFASQRSCPSPFPNWH